MTSQREKQQLMAEHEKMKMEEEHKVMVDTLMKQEAELKNHRDQLKLQQKMVEELVEGNEKKLQSVEKDLTEKVEDKKFSSSAGYLKLKEIISKYSWDLKDTLKELEKLVQNTEQLLVTTEQVIVRTEKKKEAENPKDEE